MEKVKVTCKLFLVIVVVVSCLSISIVSSQSSSGESYDDMSVGGGGGGAEESSSQEQALLPLRITQQPQSQIALAGAKVVFKCEYESSQALGYDSTSIRVRWLFNLKPILAKSEQRDDTDLSLNGLNYVINNQYSVDKNRLVVIAFDPQAHAGQYRCLVNNTLFSPPLVVLSEPANLSLARIDSVDSSRGEESVQLNLSEGNVAIISCKLPVSNPPAVPVFYLNDAPLTASPISYSNQFSAASNDCKLFPSSLKFFGFATVTRPYSTVLRPYRNHTVLRSYRIATLPCCNRTVPYCNRSILF